MAHYRKHKSNRCYKPHTRPKRQGKDIFRFLSTLALVGYGIYIVIAFFPFVATGAVLAGLYAVSTA